MAGMSGGSMGHAMTAEQMAQSHKAGVEAFPAETQGTGNELLKPIVENGVKVFTLTTTEVKWETSPGTFVDAMAYNGSQVGIDDEFTLFLGDGPLGYVLNGKGFPATQPIVAKTGDWVLIHIANDGAMLLPMHLHGYHFEVVAQDGFPLENPYMADTLVVAPGQRFDILVYAIYPGAWALHCHILPRVEGPEGMYGMVTALVVQ